MFTGIVEETGILRERERTGPHPGARSWQLGFRATKVLEGTRPGDSIAVDGVCLTVATLLPDGFRAEVMPETVRATTLTDLGIGAPVNLERALAVGGRLGGHFVSGHVDGVARILSRTSQENAVVLRLSLAPELRPFLVRKGSVAVDGTSLTVMAADAGSFTVALIPHTREFTVLGEKPAGARVNLECDLLAKYVAARTGRERSLSALDETFLRRCGFA